MKRCKRIEATSTILSSAQIEDLKKQSVGVLYDMDRFIMSVYDHEGWLMNGVPDGEFDETSREEAEVNYKDHFWMIEDIDNRTSFCIEDLSDFAETFYRCTSNSRDFDAATRKKLYTEVLGILAQLKSSQERAPAESDEKIMSFTCPECRNNTLYSVDGEVHRVADIDHHQRFICDECGAELLAELQFDGTVKFVASEDENEDW